MLKSIVGFFVVTFASIAACGLWAYDWWTSNQVTLPNPVTFEIKEGSNVQNVSQELHSLGLISHDPRLFVWCWRIMMQKTTLKAGDYRLEGDLTPAKIAQILAKGQVVTVSLTIPEGWNMYQIAERLQNAFPKTNKDSWVHLMKEKKYTRQLPGQPASVEGFLFPETYTFRARSHPDEVLETMIRTFKKNFTEEIVIRGQALNLNPLAIVTLASIIEKETGKASERPHISSVFHNRMRIGMRLQTDPTVIYGMWERFDGNLRKDDLRTPTPYNTYVISGLPPGPIANPGIAALKAAVEPLQTKDLYFVSRGDGSHIFSTNFEDHQRSVYQYQVAPTRNRPVKN